MTEPGSDESAELASKIETLKVAESVPVPGDSGGSKKVAPPQAPADKDAPNLKEMSLEQLQAYVLTKKRMEMMERFTKKEAKKKRERDREERERERACNNGRYICLKHSFLRSRHC